MHNSMMYQPLTINSLIDHAGRYHGETEIVTLETSGEISRTNWVTVNRNARKLASALTQFGLQPGHRVATLAWNNRRHLEIYFGVAGNGMVCHTINPRLFSEQLVYIINHAEDQLLFIDTTFLPLLKAIRPRTQSLRGVVVMAQRDEPTDKEFGELLYYDEFLAGGNDEHEWPHIDELCPSSLCYTSGTTGNPKGVLFTHRSTVLHSLGGNQPDGLGISANDVVMPVVPMFHVNAWGVPYVAAATGCKLVLPGHGLDGASLVQRIDDEKVTLAMGVPSIWQGLLTALKASDSKLDSLVRSIVGGSALPPSMIDIFRDNYDVELIHAWGMTETSPLGTLNQFLQKHRSLSTSDQAKIRLCQGRPPYGVELRIVDAQGKPLAEDGKTQGDVQIRGHWIVDTYFNSSTTALTDDGWFDTGDVATFNADGYLTIRDRSKDIIKSGGEWISTVELENIAIGHPGVSNAAVVGARHEKWDERPVLIAIKADGQDPDEAELLGFYKGRIADWQIPDKVVFVDTLPMGATGKVLKNRLRESYGGVLMEDS